ncbi:hypothetical protein BH23GEM9_BH23GEM9_17810 [soil metagenome]
MAPRNLVVTAVAVGLIAALAGCVTSQVAKSGESGAPGCDRECLIAVADRYLRALATRNPAPLPVARAARNTENGDVIPVGEGLWKRAGVLGAYGVKVVDPEAGAVAVQTILQTEDGPVQLLLRLKVDKQQITELETLIAREGDTCCWDLGNLEKLSGVFDAQVPLGARSTRVELVRIAADYFTALHTAGTAEYRRTVVDSGMERFENGKRTTNVVGGNRIIRRDAQTQLDSAMFGRIAVVDRRYQVVDTVRGTLLGIVVFEYPTSERPSEVIAEFFKIVDGRISEIRAVMVKQPSAGWK